MIPRRSKKTLRENDAFSNILLGATVSDCQSLFHFLFSLWRKLGNIDFVDGAGIWQPLAQRGEQRVAVKP